MKKKRPLITGTMLWYVAEHRYYVPGNPAPVLEYCVCSGLLTGYYNGGRYIEFCVRGRDPGNRCVPHRFNVASLGKGVFLNPWDAAQQAKRMTEQHEKTFWYALDHPLRRTWEKWLNT